MASSTKLDELKERLQDDLSLQTYMHDTYNIFTILKAEHELVLPSFTTDDAWAICSALREILCSMPAVSAVVDVSLANSNHVLAHATTHGTWPESDIWVSRKRNTVCRWGHSTWYMAQAQMGSGVPMDQISPHKLEESFALGETASDYTVQGGGFPIRVRDVEGAVAVVVVHGLSGSGSLDHELIIQVLRAYLQDLASSR
ncbi:uncharacterized protein BDZ99DRAFT_468809 [Mytilinidion resinicola]|uniref:DUF336-domain-containing protein n=1 Tax=Mytilinidion resinicola TaxID=574789 RepID=A0A6A6Y264_9PEZI|nr:uncharacterized protein BDZ99DRAFT_468809 [Mytilinidion resinicola]KAF2802603.1 hypothetical protein BDZ99DRAFT_468809 [Mytilinidion resinicola]